MRDFMDYANRLVQFSSLLERSIKVGTTAQAKALSKATGQEFSVSDLGTVSKAFLNTYSELLKQPADLLAYQRNLFFKSWSIWSKAWLPTEEKPKDRRFNDPKWSSDPLAKLAKDAQLALEDAVSELLASLPQGSKDHMRAEFYTRQLLSALSPSNYLAFNPAARNRFLETDGQSLLDGFANLLDDLERGDGRLDIATNNERAFVVGKDLATTPGKVVYENELMQLIQYDPLTPTQHKRPFLYVPAWINKFYILDMRPENSLVRYMLERGHTVFIISWVNPDAEHADKSFEDYMRLGPIAALDVIQEATGEDSANILGFCIGGILVTATLAYLAAKGEAHRIGSATTLATMVDFTDVGEIGVFVDHDRLDALREHMKGTGYLENHHLQEMFSMIRENDLVWSFHVMNYLMGKKPPAFDLLFWNSDSTRLPAAMLLWYLEKIYLQNGLRKPGFLSMDGVGIDISKIETPCFVLATKEDHIAPWCSVYPTAQLLGGEVKFVLGGSGHIAGVINPPTGRSKYGYWLNDDCSGSPEEWLANATHTEGSWWPEWAEWVESKDKSERVAARRPGEGALEIIEEAPGSYVLTK
ncbi:PHA/PHB synthase family protein [Ruegeria sp. SCP11]|uniref:PHA/PHB synthase family protein n=1 Tax=Ruegeria sp. SCP11 TaxID=3141378 RepID=UPI00333B44A2